MEPNAGKKRHFTFAVLGLSVPVIPICAFLQRAAEREKEV